MPKKFKGGENSKAAVARARKAETKAAENAKKEKEKEDEYWKDDDKHVAKKQQRKADREKKRLEEVSRKHEAKKLLEEEESALPAKPAGKPGKLTRAEIEANRERQRAEEEEARKQKGKIPEVALEENPNIAAAEAAATGQIEARSVEDAIAVLGVNEPAVDKHPEKRMKAAFLAYEEIHLPILKAENPNLRLSQLKQMLKKDWAKSPENPLNQRLANATR